MVLHKLNAGVVVGGVELIRDVPAQGAKLAALLDDGVQETDTVQHGLPLRHVGDVQEILRDACVRPLETGFDALWWLVGELDGNLCQAKASQNLRFSQVTELNTKHMSQVNLHRNKNVSSIQRQCLTKELVVFMHHAPLHFFKFFFTSYLTFFTYISVNIHTNKQTFNSR